MRHAKSLFCSSLLLVSLLIGSLVQAAEHPGYIDARQTAALLELANSIWNGKFRL